MGTWCTEGVKRQREERYQRYLLKRTLDDKRELEEENEQLRKRLEQMEDKKK